MDSAERCCLARVRLLALDAMASIGGQPTLAQCRRAVGPLAGRVARAARPPWEPGGTVFPQPGVAKKIVGKR